MSAALVFFLRLFWAGVSRSRPAGARVCLHMHRNVNLGVLKLPSHGDRPLVAGGHSGLDRI